MRALRVVAVVACLVAAQSPSLAEPGIAVPPEESVAGFSQSEWSRLWWQWAGSFELDQSPVADRTGKYCHLKQEGAVWFLAGTYGSARTVRTCTVPRGKYLFFPLINYAVMPRHERATDCEAFTRIAKSSTDDASALVLDLDGKRVEGLARYRQATTECFDMAARSNRPYKIYPSAANGYYVMLRPLKPGRHELNFGGVLPDTVQAVTYTLIVK